MNRQTVLGSGNFCNAHAMVELLRKAGKEDNFVYVFIKLYPGLTILDLSKIRLGQYKVYNDMVIID